ncbi:MAG: MFS transporter, partial [Rikenellaceae bacterium]|nr:MFS transporter [Rikenellaceae bacterium]
DPFKISDLGKILSSSGFWLVALLCVLYYSAIFPFQKYAVNMLQCNLTFTTVDPNSFWATNTVTVIQYIIMLIVAAAAFASNFSKNKNMKNGLLVLAVAALVVFCYMGYMRQSAETVFAVFPLLAVGITPILGNFVDHKGKAASMLVLGSLLLIACHLTFAFVLPMFKGNAVGGIIVAYLTILVLGASFSLVPASLWPSVPKLVDSKIIGSADALIFWIQNIGLWLFPLLIGKVLDKTNPELVEGLKNGTITPEQAAVSYNYTAPLVMLACLGVAALLLGFVLKVVDKKKGLGLEEPNIK